MANDARIVLQQRLSQQLVMTPQLRQAIKILQVSRAELETLVDQELTENPLLEEQAEEQEASTVGEIDWKEFAENYGNDMHGSSGGTAPSDDDDRRPALENILVKRTLLPDHLMWQLRLSDLSNTEKEVGAILIGSLDKDGYLTVSLEEAAFLANVWPDTAIVERVLMRLQEFDP